MVTEAHVLLLKCKSDLARWSVSLFGDNDLDDSFMLARFKAVGAVKDEYRIRVLLD
jgi:hypothetical protein